MNPWIKVEGSVINPFKSKYHYRVEVQVKVNKFVYFQTKFVGYGVGLSPAIRTQTKFQINDGLIRSQISLVRMEPFFYDPSHCDLCIYILLVVVVSI